MPAAIKHTKTTSSRSALLILIVANFSSRSSRYIARHHPHESLSGLLRILFDSEAGACIRAWGSWSRLTWLRQLYINETATFLRSKKGRDPMQSWRHDKVTVNQKHLVREIARALGIAEPKFRKRGSAFEWLKEQGGNPRFWTPPTMPALPALPEHLA